MKEFAIGGFIGLALVMIIVLWCEALAYGANSQYGPDYPVPATPVIVQEPNFTG
jgi:hypothetical protein